MRRDLAYLGALLVTPAAMIVFEFWLLVAAAVGLAWMLCRGPLRPMWTAPAAVVGLACLVLVPLSAAGVECPREGMDNMGQCGGLATAGIFVFFGALIALQLAAIVTLGALLLRAARGVRARWLSGFARK